MMNTKLKYNKNRFIVIIIYSILILFNILFLNKIEELDYNIWLNLFVKNLIFIIFTQSYFYRKIHRTLFDLNFLFIILSYLFHFGHHFVLFFNPSFELAYTSYLNTFSPSLVVVSSKYILLVIQAVYFGMIIIPNKFKKNKKVKNIDLLYFGYVFIVLFFPIQIYIDINNLINSLNHNYIDTFAQSVSGTTVMLGYFSNIGFSFLILNKENNRLRNNIFYFISIYLILTMISGHRGHQLTLLIYYSFIYFKNEESININKIFKYLLYFYVLVAFLNSIAIIRNENVDKLSLLINIFTYQLKGGVLENLVFELGSTYKTTLIVMDQVPNIIKPAKGLTYLSSFASIFPNILPRIEELVRYSSFVGKLNVHALGGSYVAETYYNFMAFGVLFSILIGIFINKVSFSIDVYLTNKDFYRFVTYMPLFTYILWWPRDKFGSMIRPFVWGIIGLWFVTKLKKEKNYIE